MKSGQLKKRLILQSKSYTQDTFGAEVVSWATVATVWGSLLPLSGRELFAQQQNQSEVTFRVVIRYYSGVDTTYRISHDSKFYDIEDVINENKRDRMMVLMCRQGVSEDVGDVAGALLLEIGDYLLLEGGDNLLLE